MTKAGKTWVVVGVVAIGAAAAYALRNVKLRKSYVDPSFAPTQGFADRRTFRPLAERGSP